jgi:hypothetical protein
MHSNANQVANLNNLYAQQAIIDQQIIIEDENLEEQHGMTM